MADAKKPDVAMQIISSRAATSARSRREFEETADLDALVADKLGDAAIEKKSVPVVAEYDVNVPESIPWGKCVAVVLRGAQVAHDTGSSYFPRGYVVETGPQYRDLMAAGVPMEVRVLPDGYDRESVLPTR